jgi:predicted AAA+ superfamily ATPase
MIKRELFDLLNQRLGQFPAVTLLGPRQVGKTTLSDAVALGRDSVYLDLESPVDAAKLAEPELYLSAYEDKLVILDEVQRMPQLFQILRGMIDRGKKKGFNAGRFLLLGSASLDLLHQSGESLAGRIAYLELTPFNLLETGTETSTQLWVRGGFPDSFLAADDNASVVWRENFIRTYLERDIPALGPRIPAETLRRFWMMLAHNQGCLFNAAQLARGLAVDGKTIARYLDLLVDLMLVRRLLPWHSNTSKRLVKSPKVYVRDSGITHTLLGIKDFESLLGHPVVGMSWENFVIENILSVLPGSATPYFYRTLAGAEIDLVIEFSPTKRWAVEIKKGLTPQPSKGFHLAIEDINAAAKFIVYSGNENYKIGNGIEVTSLSTIMKLLREYNLS